MYKEGKYTRYQGFTCKLHTLYYTSTLSSINMLFIYCRCDRILMMVTVTFSLLMTSFFHGSSSLPVESCPMFGCRPSGTFSYDLDVTNNVSLAWPRPFRQAESPDTLGCLGNEELVVCQGDGRINR